MRSLHGITINGEWLGNNVTINGLFRTICNISPIVMQEFIRLINKIDKLDDAVHINKFSFPDNNSVEIEFSNSTIKGLASLYFQLNKGNPELISTKLDFYTQQIYEVIENTNIEDSKEFSTPELSTYCEEKTQEIETIEDDNSSDSFSSENEEIKTLDENNIDKSNISNLPQNSSTEIADYKLEEFSTNITNKKDELNIIEEDKDKSFNNTPNIIINSISNLEEDCYEHLNTSVASSIEITESNFENKNEIENNIVSNDITSKEDIENKSEIDNIEENFDDVIENSVEALCKELQQEDTYIEISEEEIEEIGFCLADFYSMQSITEKTEEENLIDIANNSTVQALLEEVGSLKSQLEDLKDEKVDIQAALEYFWDNERKCHVVNDEDTDFRIMGDGDRVNASMLDEDIFLAGDKLYRWGETLYLEE